MPEIKEKEEFSKYEIARIIGARALQISMNAPLLLKISKQKLEEINYNPLKIAEIEFKEKVLPITVKRPLPKKIEEEIEEEKAEEEGKKEEKKVSAEEQVEKAGEMMELAQTGEEEEETGVVAGKEESM